MQKRFLDVENLGMRRIAPIDEIPHPKEVMQKDTFQPRFSELPSIRALQRDSWQVGLYLYGRRATETTITKEGKKQIKLAVEYPLNPALPVTPGLERKQLEDSKKLLKKVETAFDSFADQNSYEFQEGKWAYVARPVRAKESCLRCHTDFTLTGKVGDKNYNYRARKVGDTIGVIVYAFAKAKDAAANKR